MKLQLFSALFLGIAHSACLSSEQLIKENEGTVNFKPDTNSRTVCWGSNAADLKHYLNKDYDKMAKDGTAISQADCDKMFSLKLADAEASADKIFGANRPDCSCARATAVDVIYDISPTIAEQELKDWTTTMNANLYYDDTEYVEAAYDWLYAYHWCYGNINRCSNDLEQIKNTKCLTIQNGNPKTFI